MYGVSAYEATSSFELGLLEKKLRKFRKCNKDVSEVYTATNIKACSGTLKNNRAVSELSHYGLANYVSLKCYWEMK
jgi:hypothetical protein